MTQLYNLLGKTFGSNNNSPIPISYQSPVELEKSVTDAVSCTYMSLKGQNIGIRLGLSSMNETEVTANVLQGLEFAITKLENGWDDVKCIHLRLSDSVALPIYQQLATSSEVKEVKSSTTEQKTATNIVSKGKKGKPADAPIKEVKVKDVKVKAVKAVEEVKEVKDVKVAKVTKSAVKAKTEVVVPEPTLKIATPEPAGKKRKAKEDTKEEPAVKKSEKKEKAEEPSRIMPKRTPKKVKMDGNE
jgi:hypothetical protein